MRMLARLLDKLRQSLNLHDETLADFLDGSYFDAVIENIENMCGLHSDAYGHKTFKTHSLALAIGNILPKSCQLKKVQQYDKEIMPRKRM
jgi:hypothetical protein